MIESRDAPDMNPLITAYLDGSIPDADAVRLECWIESSPANVRAFSELALLHRHLTERAQPEARSTPQPKPERTISAAGAPIYRKGSEPQASRFRPFHYAVGTIAATLLAACGVAVYLLAFNAPVDPQPDPTKRGPAVATLIQNTGDLRTPADFPVEGESSGPGEYALSSGTAEFMLTNAVNVKLHGNTRLHMRNDMNIALTRGSAEFVVPPDARGFTVHLPDSSRIVDLGTAFSIDIDESDRIKAIVTEGVVVLLTRDAQSVEVGRLIHSGHAFALHRGAVDESAVRDVPIANASFELDARGATIGPKVRFVNPDQILGWRARGAVVAQMRTSEFIDDELDNFESTAIVGDRTAQVSAAAPANDPPYIAQTLEHPLEPGATYTLTVAVGRRLDHDRLKMIGADWALGFYDADTGTPLDTKRSIATGALRPGQGGTATDQSVAYVAGPHDADRRVEIRLINRATGESFNGVNFDNVRLTVSRPIHKDTETANVAE